MNNTTRDIKSSNGPSGRPGSSLLAAALCVVAGLASSVTVAQEREAGAPASAGQLKELIEQVLPPWDDSILQVPDVEGWTDAFKPELVADAVEDGELAEAVQGSTTEREVVQTSASTLRYDTESGLVRYVNRERAKFVLEPEPRNLASADYTRDRSIDALLRIGLPERQIGDFDIDTQMIGSGRAGSTEAETVREAFRLLNVKRQLNGYPVFMSGARVAIDADGQVQRLRVRWPSFKLDQNDRLLERDIVIEQVVKTLFEQSVSIDAEIRASLGYVQTTKDGRGPFQPVVLVSANDAPSPFLFTVPVVAPGSGSR